MDFRMDSIIAGSSATCQQPGGLKTGNYAQETKHGRIMINSTLCKAHQASANAKKMVPID
jgi:hypothetical protein